MKIYKCYEKLINDEVMEKYEFETVLYDETENFRNYDSPLFNYPFELRKTKMSSDVFRSKVSWKTFKSYQINF